MVRNNIKKIIKEENSNFEDEVLGFEREISAKEHKLHQKDRERVERLLMENEELKTQYLNALRKNDEQDNRII